MALYLRDTSDRESACPRQPVRVYPDLRVKQAVLQSLFGEDFRLTAGEEDAWSEFFDYYGREASDIDEGNHPQTAKKFARDHVPTHRELCDLMRDLLNEGANLNRAQLRARIRSNLGLPSMDDGGHFARPVSSYHNVHLQEPQRLLQPTTEMPHPSPPAAMTTDLEEEKPEDNVLDTIIRLALMINVNKTPDGGTNSVEWAFSDRRSLRHFLRDTFPAAKHGRSGSDERSLALRLHPFFTAAFMERICGLRLEWTDSLQDHLRLFSSSSSASSRKRRQRDQAPLPPFLRWMHIFWNRIDIFTVQSVDETRVLRIFGHKRWLLEQIDLHPKASSRAAATESPASPGLKLPLRLLEDTIASLDLLFPLEDNGTKELCGSLDWTFPRIGQQKRRRLNLRSFVYWRERLQELNEDVFLAPPASWKQLFYDKRNPQQYWTFWIAIIILLLTIVSTFATILQTVYSILGYYKGG